MFSCIMLVILTVQLSFDKHFSLIHGLDVQHSAKMSGVDLKKRWSICSML